MYFPPIEFTFNSPDLFMFKQTKISKKAFAVRMSTNACFGVFNVSKEERDIELILDVVDTISVSFYFCSASDLLEELIKICFYKGFTFSVRDWP